MKNVKGKLIGTGACTLCLFAGIGMGSAGSGDALEQAAATPGPTVTVTQKVPGPTKTVTVKVPAKTKARVKPAEAPKPAQDTSEPTSGQRNALGSAQSYLDFAGFSYKGLIHQLMAGDGYSKDDATWAANHVNADWNKQAEKSAKSYLEFTHFSRDGLIHQLEAGDNYTHEQAVHGADVALG